MRGSHTGPQKLDRPQQLLVRQIRHVHLEAHPQDPAEGFAMPRNLLRHLVRRPNQVSPARPTLGLETVPRRRRPAAGLAAHSQPDRQLRLHRPRKHALTG